jgi:hypothetical protein
MSLPCVIMFLGILFLVCLRGLTIVVACIVVLFSLFLSHHL